jgi:TolB-like protein
VLVQSIQFLIPVVLLMSSVSYSKADESAHAPDLIRIGVLDLESEDLTSSEIRLLSDRLRLELFKTQSFEVVEREQINEILSELEFQQSGCVATECIAQIGHFLGADAMVTGSIGRIGQMYTVNIRLIDVETATIGAVAIRDCSCPLHVVLTTSISQAARELVNPEVGHRPAVVSRGEGRDRTANVDYTQFERTSGGKSFALTLVVLIVVTVLLMSATSGT